VRTPDLSGNQVIGLLVHDVSNPYYGLVTRGVQDVAVREDYTLQLVDTLESEDRERKACGARAGSTD
jgi:DNA-binding LacI/PurR family transcriptional regulator